MAVAGVVAALVTVVSFAIPFPSGIARLMRVLACCATAGLIWQSFRDRISRAMVAWLVVTGLAAVSLIFVLADDGPESRAEATMNPGPAPTTASSRPGPEKSAAVQSTAPPTSPPASEDPLTEVPASPSPPNELPLDELPVVDGGDDWRRGEVTLSGESYAESLVAPHCGDSDDYISYNLHREWTRFRATVGVADDARTGSSASFHLEADGDEVFSTEPLVPGDQEELDVRVEGAFRLTLWSTTSCGAGVGAWGSPTLGR